VKYIIQIKNSGGRSIKEIELIDSLPLGMKYINSTLRIDRDYPRSPDELAIESNRTNLIWHLFPEIQSGNTTYLILFALIQSENVNPLENEVYLKGKYGEKPIQDFKKAIWLNYLSAE